MRSVSTSGGRRQIYPNLRSRYRGGRATTNDAGGRHKQRMRRQTSNITSSFGCVWRKQTMARSITRSLRVRLGPNMTSATAQHQDEGLPTSGPEAYEPEPEQLDDTEKTDPIMNSAASERSGRSTQTDHDRADNTNDVNPQDLESLQTVPTNSPPWSIFTPSQKRFIVLMVAIAGFFSPLSANIYFPALNTLSTDFHVTPAIMNLTLTSYMIFQGLAPTIFGDLADMAGRRPAYIIGFAVYIGACIGIACCDSYAALLASGVVADIATSAERGVWMGWATSGPMVAPAIAPVLGGIFAQFLGWRWIFWFLVILVAVFMIPFLITFPETGRNVVGNGSIPPQSWNHSLLSYLQAKRLARDTPPLHRTLSQETTRTAQQKLAQTRNLRIPNPLNTLHILLEKDVALLLLYNSLVYCAFYDVMASAPQLFAETYGYDALQIGLCFLPFGCGCFLAPALVGKAMDINFRRNAKKIGYTIVKGKANDLRNFPLEKTRIQIALPLVFVGDAALLCYGWVMQVQTSLAAPLVLMFIMGLTLTGAFNAMSVMLVDLYLLSPATATAANNLVRCLMGAGATGVIIYMIEAMGRGWCFTFIAGVVAVFSPILWVLERWGPGWREARRARVEEVERRRAAVKGERVDGLGTPDLAGSEKEARGDLGVSLPADQVRNEV
ncbi:hypothetical protein LTR57_002452 [Friedmanniomyces endolithicus]|nr:hypothetical protein LTR94_000576 [Friedmanniomyces endolithicus]KAK0788227.1 hypothetical protein LTR59_010048 [Friedmanniomyces endolithicus]KAK0928832.1 hypothetical protein LTR57_002452 [Friedmanniomyces endolithicus]